MTDRRAFRAAILDHLNEPLQDGTGKTRLQAIAERLVDQAFNGDVASVKELRAIVDGKSSEDSSAAADAVNEQAERVLLRIEAAIGRAADSFAAPPLIEVVSDYQVSGQDGPAPALVRDIASA